MNYILEGHTPVAVCDLSDWARWFQTADRHVAVTKKDKVRISTVFLGVDYDFSTQGPPILFETMVFGGEFDQEQACYSTWGEAVEGHNAMVRRIFGDK